MPERGHPITCRDFLREVSDYLDDAVDVGLKAELERHITQCPNCFVVLDTTKKTLQVYKGQEAKQLPDQVESRLLAALQKKIASRSRA